jgi:hypothetical protein
MDYLLFIVGGFLMALVVFALGYLTAVRELGKDVAFWKDCSVQQRTTINAYMQEVDTLQRKLRD